MLENDGAFIIGLNSKCVTNSRPIERNIVIENGSAFIVIDDMSQKVNQIVKML